MMEISGSLLRTAGNYARSKIRCIVLISAVLVLGLLLITEFEIAGHFHTLQWWQRFTEVICLAALLGSSIAAIVMCRKCEKMRNLESRTRVKAVIEARTEGAMQDPLTELPNGRALLATLKDAIECSPGRKLAFYLLDPTDFKSINKAYGAATGDAILRAVALRLRSVPHSDDAIARFDSDAFAMLARDVGSRREAIEIGQRYVAALDDPISIGNRAHPVGVDVGLALYPDDGATPEELVHHAELAMLSEKASRRSEMPFFVAMTSAPAV